MVFKLVGIQEAERALAAVKLMTGDVSKGIKGLSADIAMSMTGANASTIAYIKTLGVASASELTFSQCVKIASMNLKANTKMLLANAAAWLKSPLGMATIAVAGIYAIIKAVKYLSEELDRSRDKLSELKNEYDSNESELKSLNDELDTTRDRIKELQALKDSGAISFTEQEELDNLNSQNAALERKIELLKIEQELKRSEINNQFVKTALKDVESQYEYDITDRLASGNYKPQNSNTRSTGMGSFATYINEQEYVNSVLLRRSEIIDRLSENITAEEKEKLNGLLVDIDTFLGEEISKLQSDLSAVSFIKGATTEDQKAANEMILVYEDMLDRIAISTGKESSRTNAFNRLVDTEFDDVTKGLKELGKEGAVTAEMLKDPAYSEFVDKCISLGVVSDASTESLNFLALGFNNLTNAASGSGAGLSGTTTAIDSINQSIDGVQSKISSLGDSLTKLRDGSLTLEEVIDLIQEFPELAEYVDLTSESFGDLDKGLQKLIRHAPDELIGELHNFKKTADLTDKQREAIDDLCASMEKLSTDAIRDASGEFGILAEAINASKIAKSELDKALAEDDYDANYNDRVEAFQKLKELINDGLVGSKAYKAITEYLNIDHLDSSGVKEYIQENDKYFKEGKQGIEAWLKEIERLNKAGILDPSVASYDSSTKRFSYDYTRLDELADAFDWDAPEMVQDMIGKFRMYSEDYIEYTTEIIQKELLMKDLIQDFGAVAITSMEDLQAYTGYTEAEIQNLVDQMNALNTAVESELRSLSAGGNVDLNLRPEIDTSELLKAGWEEDVVGEAGNIATVFSSTFSNKAGNIAMNFTPIQVDKNGNYVGVLDPQTFEQYCEDVVAGVREDDLNLKIGATYTGHDAIKQAEIDANRIHELHAMLRASGEIKILGVDDIQITQSIVDSMSEALGSIDEVKEALYDLYNTKGVTFDSEITLNGQSIQEIITAQKEKAEDAVTVDVNMTINDQEVIASVTSTAAEMKRILGEDWEVILNSEDVETKGEAIETLLEKISDPVTVTANGKTYNAINGLEEVLGLIKQVQANSVITVQTNYTSSGSAPKNYGANENKDNSAWANRAKGTRRDPGGVALLGDEYSSDGSPKPELVISDGFSYIAGQDGPELVDLKRGDQVVPADETKRILSGNPNVRRNTIPAFATGAGGYPAGSVQEDKYLEGVIGPTEAWLKAQEQKKNAQSSGTSAYWESQKTSSSITVTPTKYTEGVSNGTLGSGRNNGSSGGSGGGSSGSSGSSSSSSSLKNEKSQFEKDYEYHQHLLAMEQESYESYIKWLEGAYADAYNKGQIELEDFYKYQEEVFQGQKELFQDSIEDIEHKIKGLERDPGNEAQIINYYNQIIQKIDNELAAARARGLNDDDDYVQELLEQKWDYADEIKDIQDEITENAKDAVEDLIDYRMDMLKQDLENERDAIGDKLDTLRDFYDKQKEMLQDAYDEEKYLEEQSEKRKSVDEIRAEMDMLRFDDSAKAQKRLKELQEELNDAEKELADFEKDHALENATDLLDKMYEQQESQMQSEMDALEEKLNDPNALYNQALRDIQNNTLALYEEMIKYNNKYGSGNPGEIFELWKNADESLDAYFKTMGESYKNILLVDAYKPTGYASGTSHATPGIHELFEGNKDEYVFTTKSGQRYRMFSGLGDKVLNASATDFLYKFANNGETFISNMLNGLVSAIGNVGKPAQQIQLSTGDIIVQGNASADTVSAIRRAQRENVDYILREFQRLNR